MLLDMDKEGWRWEILTAVRDAVERGVLRGERLGEIAGGVQSLKTAI